MSAEPAQLAPLRDQLAVWAAGTGLSAGRVQDLLLGVHEAMANVVVHAYADRGGTFGLHGRRTGDSVTVTVSDHGHWNPVARSSLWGGRGLPLIHALADRATIETSAAGTTTVTMTWTCESLRPR
ncbi:ATP-binding protein [Amycolatopsis sp. lyj-346]|uniref:ATP-binding protein n=1 Tax=Amycolatopsis sp. lyj-346 TaxID=2789289 RepID=UPI00397D6C1B